jgi:hypothetical protein
MGIKVVRAWSDKVTDQIPELKKEIKVQSSSSAPSPFKKQLQHVGSDKVQESVAHSLCCKSVECWSP